MLGQHQLPLGLKSCIGGLLVFLQHWPVVRLFRVGGESECTEQNRRRGGEESPRREVETAHPKTTHTQPNIGLLSFASAQVRVQSQGDPLALLQCYLGQKLKEVLAVTLAPKGGSG